MKNQDIFFKRNPIPMWVFSRQSLKILAANNAALELYGYSENEILSITIKDLRSQREIPKLINELDKHVTAYSDAGVWKHVTKTGEIIYVHIVSSPIDWEGEKCKLVVGQNVSDQRDIDQLIFDDKSLFDTLIQNFPGIFVLINKKYEIIRWNLNALKFLGYSSVDFHRLNILKLASSEKDEKFRQFINSAFNSGWAEAEINLLTKTKEEIPFLLKMNKVFISGEPHLMSIGVNVRSFKEAEFKLNTQLLTEKEERHRIEVINSRLKLIETASQIFVKENNIIKALKKVAALLIREVADTCSINLLQDGKPYRAIYKASSKEVEQKALELNKKYPNTLFAVDKFNKVMESGEPYYHKSIKEQYLKSFAVDNEHLKLLKAFNLKSYILLPLKVGGRKLGVISLIIMKGSRRFYVDDENFLTELAEKMSLYIDNFLVNENLKELNATLEDKVAERTKQLQMTNKELESFSYSVSHDLRAPLRAITGYSNFLIEDHLDNLNEEGQEFLTIVHDETRRMGLLIDELLAFSRMSRTEKQDQKFSMDALVKDVIQDLKISSPNEDPEFIVSKLPKVVADPNLIRQVWLNLLSNSIKYKHENKRQRIKINAQLNQDGDEYIFSIEDNGVGFNMKYYDKLFEVFQRLHSDDEFEGTGIGLALSQRIIFRHEGQIWAESEKDKGSIFYFSLPVKQLS